MATKRQIIAWELWTQTRTSRQRHWVALRRWVHPWLLAGFAAWVSRRRMGGSEGLFRHVFLSFPSYLIVWTIWLLGYSWRRR